MNKTLAFLFAIIWFVIAGCDNNNKQAQSVKLRSQVTIGDLTKVYDDTSRSERDKRFTEIRHTDLPYKLQSYKSLSEWEKKAAELLDHIWVSAGLMPNPEKTPLKPRIFDRIERPDYTVEKVFIESYPNFYVPGNLYRPKGKTPPYPAVLCPHGHWGKGRIAHEKAVSVPGRCINFAKQGYVVFNYPMVGFNDSQQADHAYGDDARLNLWGINLMGLQLWNSIRALDFISSLPGVDKERIGCTGASGGGTQTFILTAVDDRIKAAAPVNMISAHFQGGCLCENAPLLRLEANNVEIGALAAPRPVLMVSATGDWTKNTLEVEYPATREIYELFNAEDKVHAVRIDEQHNYNRQSREAVYSWFGRWLLNEANPEKLKETDFEVEKDEDLLVFANRPLPVEALDSEGLTAKLIESRKKQLHDYIPKDRETLKKFRDVIGTAMKHTLAVSVPSPSDLVIEPKGAIASADYKFERLLIGRKDVGDRIPAILYLPKKIRRKNATLIVHPRGKSALVDSQKIAPIALVDDLLKGNQVVLLIDCFNTGEHIFSEKSKNRSEGIEHFTTFNRTDMAMRIQDILTSLGYLNSRKDVKSINLLGLDEAGLWCLLARTQAPNVSNTVVDVDQFNTTSDSFYLGSMYIPGLRRAGDFVTAAGLIAPAKLFIHNTGMTFTTDFIQSAYHAARATKKLVVIPHIATNSQIVNWICGG